MKSVLTLAVVAAFAAPAFAGSVSNTNGLNVRTRIFNDFPSSTLSVTNNYPSSLRITENPFGAADPDGNGFANRHSAYFSNDGGTTANDIDYVDGFDAEVTLDLTADFPAGKEAGFHTDLFGFGFFGVLPNGEIAAFGSILPFKTFGNVWTPGQQVTLRMILTPGDGNGLPGNTWTIPSTIEYIYDLGSGPVSSGAIPFTNGEGGVPSAFPFFVGVGVQNGQAGLGGGSDALFSNFKVSGVSPVPAPGAAAMLGLAGLAGLRRRR